MHVTMDQQCDPWIITTLILIPPYSPVHHSVAALIVSISPQLVKANSYPPVCGSAQGFFPTLLWGDLFVSIYEFRMKTFTVVYHAIKNNPHPHITLLTVFNKSQKDGLSEA